MTERAAGRGDPVDGIRTRAVVSRRKNDPVQVETIVLEPPGSHEVLVRMQASGICHSDMHYRDGALGDGYPFILGHEGAGTIEAVGDAVSSVAVGDYVVLTYRAPCGRCRFCMAGRLDNCVSPVVPSARMWTSDGAELTRALGLGTFAERLVVDADQAIRISRSCPPAPASLLGCGVITGVGGVMYTAQVRPEDTVAVFGCGGVGANVIMGARLARARRIIAIDLVPRKLEWARELGATDLVDASSVDPVAAVRELTDGHGVSVAFEVVGIPATLRQAISVLDYRGTAVMVGFPRPQAVLELDMQPYFFTGANLKVSLGGDGIPQRDYPLLASWYASGDLDLDRLVTNRVGLGDVESAFAAMAAGEALRSVIEFPGHARPSTG